MPFNSTDILKSLGNPSTKFTLNLATSGVQTLFTFPVTNLGIPKYIVNLIVIEGFSAGATTATSNFGSSAGTQNDYVNAQSVNPANTPIFIWPPTTKISYNPGVVFQINTTGAGSGTATVSIWTTGL